MAVEVLFVLHGVGIITVCRFLRLRVRGCVYAETCAYARGYLYAPAVYTHYRSRKRTYPRGATLETVHIWATLTRA